MSLRVLSWNVRSMRDDVDALVAVIRDTAPDVVCVQEAPRFFRWRTRCAELARRSGLLVVSGGRPAGDCLLLAHIRVEVRDAHAERLTRTPGLHRRGLAHARVRADGAELVVASAHLGLRTDERLRHAAEIAALLSPYSLPVVLGADVNEQPGELAWELLSARWPAAPALGGTFTSRSGGRQIDGVFTDLPVRSASVLTGPLVQRATDHRPVLVDLEPS